MPWSILSAARSCLTEDKFICRVQLAQRTVQSHTPQPSAHWVLAASSPTSCSRHSSCHTNLPAGQAAVLSGAPDCSAFGAAAAVCVQGSGVCPQPESPMPHLHSAGEEGPALAHSQASVPAVSVFGSAVWPLCRASRVYGGVSERWSAWCASGSCRYHSLYSIKLLLSGLPTDCLVVLASCVQLLHWQIHVRLTDVCYQYDQNGV